MKTKERKTMRRRWILLGILLAAVVAVGSFAMGETPERPVSAGERGAPYAANGSAEAGAFTVTGEGLIDGEDYSYDSGILTIQSNKEMTIANTNPGETADRIKIQSPSGVHLTLAGVNIKTNESIQPTLEIEENATFDVNITLADGTINTLDASSSRNAAGLQKNGDTSTGTLTIQGGSSGTGRLNATGGERAAGIGGGQGGTGSNITIEGGDVTATGGANGGAGIGGGGRGSGSNITISGGTVTAIGGADEYSTGGGAGIGGGFGGSGSSITIRGGMVTATGKAGAAGIGGGKYESGSNIEIIGGTVTAQGEYKGAGIGGGYFGSGSNITITGGTVTAIGGADEYSTGGGAGIGGGGSETGSDNSLDGNAVVKASSGNATVDAMQGFTYTKGVAFTAKGAPAADNKYAGVVYGEVATGDLPGGSLTFPENTATLTIPETSALTVSSGKTLTIPDGATLHNEAGTLNANKEGYGSITCEDTGKVTVQMGYEANGGAGALDAHAITYQDSSGADKKYDAAKDLKAPTTPPEGQYFAGWYSDDVTFESRITKDTAIDCNLHRVYAKWEEDTCPFDVTGGARDTDWSYDDTNKVLTIKTVDQALTIANKVPATETDARVAIGELGDSSKTLSLTLDGVNIKTTSGDSKPALKIADNAAYNVNITLADGTANTLDASSSGGAAGLQKNGDPTMTQNLGTLTIQAEAGGEGDGSLMIQGGSSGAGIGGGYDKNGSNITIDGGKVMANGGSSAAGIGGGVYGSGSGITIEGGTVTAQGGYNGAGIGGGYRGTGSDITIEGGKVEATGGDRGAGIGGGNSEDESNITISGGMVNAKGGQYGAGIGGGESGTASTIEITGGTVIANGGEMGAGIGGGASGTASTIEITGGTVIANGGEMGAGIGGGSEKGGNNITISGGTVTATGSYGGAGIGGGVGGNGKGVQITGGAVTAQGGAAGIIERLTVTEGAGIGGGGGVSDIGIPAGTGKDNSLDGDAVVLSTSGGAGKNALEGFDAGSSGSLTKGIAFTRQSATATWSQGEMYGGSVAVTADATFPANLTIPEGKILTVNEGVALTFPADVTLNNQGTLQNKGALSFEGSGRVTTRVSYREEESNLDDRDILYQNASGVQSYTCEDLPRLEKGETVVLGWYFDEGRISEAKVGENVQLNEHLLFAKWGTRPAPDPTPDPSVDPGSDGSDSAKTTDFFAGGMALVLLGAASVAGIALKKRK